MIDFFVFFFQNRTIKYLFDWMRDKGDDVSLLWNRIIVSY